MLRHGTSCLAAHAAKSAAQGRQGRLSSRLGTSNTLVESFALDPAVYQCVDRGCRGAVQRQAAWWWYLVVAGGAVLVMCICAGGVLFSVARNQGKKPPPDRTQESVPNDSLSEDDPEQIEEGAGVGPLIPRP